jgi:hypothetical protein
MRKLNKSEIRVAVGPQLVEDPDELQLLDECNLQWAKAWIAAAKKSTELKAQVVCQMKRA